jgi:hypothetical protein
MAEAGQERAQVEGEIDDERSLRHAADSARGDQAPRLLLQSLAHALPFSDPHCRPAPQTLGAGEAEQGIGRTQSAVWLAPIAARDRLLSRSADGGAGWG